MGALDRDGGALAMVVWHDDDFVTSSPISAFGFIFVPLLAAVAAVPVGLWGAALGHVVRTCGAARRAEDRVLVRAGRRGRGAGDRGLRGLERLRAAVEQPHRRDLDHMVEVVVVEVRVQLEAARLHPGRDTDSATPASIGPFHRHGCSAATTSSAMPVSITT